MQVIFWPIKKRTELPIVALMISFRWEYFVSEKRSTWHWFINWPSRFFGYFDFGFEYFMARIGYNRGISCQTTRDKSAQLLKGEWWLNWYDPFPRRGFENWDLLLRVSAVVEIIKDWLFQKVCLDGVVMNSNGGLGGVGGGGEWSQVLYSCLLSWDLIHEIE